MTCTAGQNGRRGAPRAWKWVRKVKLVRALAMFLIVYGVLLFMVFRGVDALYALEHVVRH